MDPTTPSESAPAGKLGELVQTLQTWPWLDTLSTLRARFREDRLGITASSLTFTTLMSLVPLLTVMLALFSAFPMFARFQEALQRFFVQSLVPTGIANQVLHQLTDFAAKAKGVGGVGLLGLALAALALMLTIDRTLNGIWRVRTPRPMAQRVLVYWAAATLGPLVLGVSLSITSYAVSASQGLVGAMPGGVTVLLGALEFLLMGSVLAGLFHYVPNTHVRWRHAIAGGLAAAAGLEVAKKLLGWYLQTVPTYTVIYGALAAVPIFLIWIYLAWVIVLLGAVIAAYAPSLHLHLNRWPDGPGARLQLALAVLRQLDRAQGGGLRGLTAEDLAAALRIDPLHTEPVLDMLLAFDWIGRLDESPEPRMVLLCEPAITPARLLIGQLLMEPSTASRGLWERAGFDTMTLRELLDL